MKKVTCDKCRMEKPNLWSINIGLKYYDICWDCKPLIEEFIETNTNDYTAGSDLVFRGTRGEGK